MKKITLLVAILSLMAFQPAIAQSEAYKQLKAKQLSEKSPFQDEIDGNNDHPADDALIFFGQVIECGNSFFGNNQHMDRHLRRKAFKCHHIGILVQYPFWMFAINFVLKG